MSALSALLRGSQRPPMFVRYRIWRDHSQADAARRASGEAFDGVIRLGPAASELAPSEIEFSIWRRRPDLLRVEYAGGKQDGYFGVAVGDRWWSWNGRDTGTRQSDSDPTSAWIGQGADRFLDPTELADVLGEHAPRHGTRIGRPVLIADAVAGSDGVVGRVGWGSLGVHADRYEVEIDVERGFVLAARAFFAGEAFQSIEAVDIECDGPVDDELFAFREPPDSLAQTDS